jgi:hypothetical protein
MKCRLSDEQRAYLATQPSLPLELVDEQSQATYVLLSGEQYQRLQAALAEDLDALRATYAAQSRALGQGGWDDPELDLYNDYDAHRG